MKTVRRIYRKHTIFRGVPFRVDLLTDLAVDEVPKILTDTTGITEAVEKIQDRDEGESEQEDKGVEMEHPLSGFSRRQLAGVCPWSHC